MKLDFLPPKIFAVISKLDLDRLYEIRLRSGQAILLNFNGKRCFLKENDISLSPVQAIVCEQSDILHVINKVTEYSVYASNEKIKEGYLTTKDGVRIGIAGECVFDGEKILTIKNFTSLNVRVPHNIIGSSDEIFRNIDSGGLCNSLIISPPGYGKTTILKDLIRNIATYKQMNILVIDERGELSVSNEFPYADYVKYSDKLYAFEYGVRSMSPDIVITDELCSREDFLCVKRAIGSGIKIIASCHSSSLAELKKKDYFVDGLFDKYVILQGKGKAGQIKEIIDG